MNTTKEIKISSGGWVTVGSSVLYIQLAQQWVNTNKERRRGKEKRKGKKRKVVWKRLVSLGIGIYRQFATSVVIFFFKSCRCRRRSYRIVDAVASASSWLTGTGSYANT